MDRNYSKQYELWLNRENKKSCHYEPCMDYEHQGSEEAIELGERLVGEGKVGCLIVAGGQASRLKYDGPKGAFPILNKSLFQIFSEKVVAASRKHDILLPVVIMTSPLNHEQTVNFFIEHDYFGLDRGQIDFFVQGMLPLFNEEGELFFDSPGHIAEAPDGNGHTLHAFYDSGVFQKWLDRGVLYLNYINVDNFLSDPYDINLAGTHRLNNNDVTIKCILREDPKESVGMIVSCEEKISVVEYSEVAPEEAVAMNSDGFLKHPCANISNFCFSMDFIRKVVDRGPCPLHLAHKAVKIMGEVSDQPNAWKFERFIFDVWNKDDKVSLLVYPRDQCFAPLKTMDDVEKIENRRR